MAFSKELEEVIDAALADGVLTDKERAVLHKKALLEGVDPDELDVVIDGRLAKMKKQEDWLRPAPPTSEKRGNVVKCPNCGAPVQSGAISCKECGYVFTNVQAVSSVAQLFEKLTKIESERRNDDYDDEVFNKASSLIKAYPIPNAKEDIIEFLTMATTYMKDGKSSFYTIVWVIAGIFLILIGIPLCLLEGLGLVPIGYGGYLIYKKAIKPSYEKRMAKVWKSKCAQIIEKAKFVLSGEPEYVKILEFERKISNKITKYIITATVVLLMIVLVYFSFSYYSKTQDAESQAKVQYEELMSKLDALETPNNKNYKELESKLLKITWTDIKCDWSSYKDNYLEKKRSLADQIGSVIIDPQEGSSGAYKYNGAPNEIRYSSSIHN